MIIEGLRVISPFPSGLGVARPRSESRLLCFLGVSCELPCICVAWLPVGHGPAERAGDVTLGASAFPQHSRDW